MEGTILSVLKPIFPEQAEEQEIKAYRETFPLSFTGHDVHFLSSVSNTFHSAGMTRDGSNIERTIHVQDDTVR